MNPRSQRTSHQAISSHRPSRLLQTFQTFAAGPSTTVPKAFTEYFNFEAWHRQLTNACRTACNVCNACDDTNS